MGWLFITLGLITVGIGSFLAIYGQQLLSSPPIINRPPVISCPFREIIVQIGQIEIPVEIRTIPIKDKDGKMGIIKVSILSKEASWDYESSDNVSLNGKSLDMEQFLNSAGMQARFETASDLIAIGAASEQGNLTSEQSRAQRRADRLVHWLRSTVRRSDVNLYTLSMGRYKQSQNRGPQETAEQRRVVIVSISEKEVDINLEEALRISLNSNPAWPFALNEYSDFALTPVT